MKSYNILIIEDEILAGMSLRIEFETLGQSVAGIVKDEAQAVAICKSQKVDVVVLDVNLGTDVSGIEIGSILRQKFGIPLLFMTGYELDIIAQDIAIVEHIGVIKKPAFARELLGVINQYFELKIDVK